MADVAVESSLQRVTEAEAQGTPARLAAAGGILFVVGLIVQNVLRSSEPAGDAQPAKVAAYFVGHRAETLVPLLLFPVGLVALLMFVAGVTARSAEGGATGRWWGRVGGYGTLAIVSLFALVNVSDIALAARPHQLAGSPVFVEALWKLHSAAFALNFAAIAVTMLGLGEAAGAAGLVPRRLVIATRIGSLCLFIPSLFETAVVNGSKILAVALVGFIVWVVFVVTASVGLWRERAAG